MSDYAHELRHLAEVIDAEDSRSAAMHAFAETALAWQDEHRKQTGEELSLREIDSRIGRGKDYTGRIVRWHTSAAGRTLTPFGGDERDISSRKAKAKRVLRDADKETVEEIVASLPKKAVDRIAKAVESRVPPTERTWTTEPRPERPKKSVFQKFADLSFGLWLLQDELKDITLEDAEREQMRSIVQSSRRFLDAVESYLDTGSFDDELADLLAEARES